MQQQEHDCPQLFLGASSEEFLCALLSPPAMQECPASTGRTLVLPKPLPRQEVSEEQEICRVRWTRLTWSSRDGSVGCLNFYVLTRDFSDLLIWSTPL